MWYNTGMDNEYGLCDDCGGVTSDPEERRCSECDDERAADATSEALADVAVGMSVRARRNAAVGDALASLFDSVWEAEADWRLCDKIDLAVRL